MNAPLLTDIVLLLVSLYMLYHTVLFQKTIKKLTACLYNDVLMISILKEEIENLKKELEQKNK